MIGLTPTSEPNNSPILKKGMVVLKRGFVSIEKYLVLCAPLTIHHIQSVYESLFVTDPNKPVELRSIPWLGNITYATVKCNLSMYY